MLLYYNLLWHLFLMVHPPIGWEQISLAKLFAEIYCSSFYICLCHTVVYTSVIYLFFWYSVKVVVVFVIFYFHSSKARYEVICWRNGVIFWTSGQIVYALYMCSMCLQVSCRILNHPLQRSKYVRTQMDECSVCESIFFCSVAIHSVVIC